MLSPTELLQSQMPSRLTASLMIAIKAENKQKLQAVMILRIALAITLVMMGAASQAETVRGPSTGLPIPRYVSIKGNESNLRRGPGFEYPIDWVYRLEGMPVMIIGESGHWRKVEDMFGERGWLHFQLLSGRRNGIITVDRAEMRDKASEDAPVIAILEQNVLFHITACTQNWCHGEVENRDGWLPKTVFWGVSSDETFED